MVESKKNYKTLFYRQGNFRIEETKKISDNSALPAIYMSFQEAIRNRTVSPKAKKKVMFVSYEDFQGLKEEVEVIKNQLHMMDKAFELEIAIKDALEYLNVIPEIQEIENISESKNLTLIVLTKSLSPNLFRKIADIEIRLAKKYVNLQIDIQPILKEEKAR